MQEQRPPENAALRAATARLGDAHMTDAAPALAEEADLATRKAAQRQADCEAYKQHLLGLVLPVNRPVPIGGPADEPGAAADGPQRAAADEASARAWDQFTATTREAIKRDTPLLASVVDFNVKERWIAVAALEEYLKVPKYAVFTTLLETNRSSLARVGVHYTKIGHALHVIIIDHTKEGAQEMPTHRTVAELGKAMDALSSREVAKLFAFWGFGDKAIELVLDTDMSGATLLALGPREFKEVGFTEPDGLFRLIGPKAKEMNRKGGAPYSVIS